MTKSNAVAVAVAEPTPIRPATPLPLTRRVDLAKDILAPLVPGADHKDRMEAANAELSAIVAATERAAMTILSRIELVEQTLVEMRRKRTVKSFRPLAERLAHLTTEIYEAVSFQDITGQRVTKVEHVLERAHERVAAAVAALDGEDVRVEDIIADEEAQLLNGPQLDHEDKMSQDAIDALFD